MCMLSVTMLFQDIHKTFLIESKWPKCPWMPSNYLWCVGFSILWCRLSLWGFLTVMMKLSISEPPSETKKENDKLKMKEEKIFLNDCQLVKTDRNTWDAEGDIFFFSLAVNKRKRGWHLVLNRQLNTISVPGSSFLLPGLLRVRN